MITSAWIAPDGTIHPVKLHKHAEFAQNLLNIKDLGNHAAILALAHLGWLHIGPAPFVSTIPYNKLPESQAIALHNVVSNSDGMIKQNLVSYIHA